MSVDAEWLTAIGTIGAVATSLFFSAQAGLRAAARERREQAEKIAAWFEPKEGVIDPEDSANVAIQNASNQPVYHVILSLVAVQGAFRRTAVGDTRSDAAKYRTLVGLVPPGRHNASLFRTNAAGVRLGVELAFEDAAGRYWVRGGSGKLKQVRQDPVGLYRVMRPVGWRPALASKAKRETSDR